MSRENSINTGLNSSSPERPFRVNLGANLPLGKKMAQGTRNRREREKEKAQKNNVVQMCTGTSTCATPLTTPRKRYAAIPTVYRDVQFKSRLEARWAAMFDRCGWPWIYEAIDRPGWIADFTINAPRQLLVEIKPALTVAELWPHTGRIDNAFPEREALLLGAHIPLARDGEYPFPAVGLLSGLPDPLEAFGFSWATAYVHRCGHCNRLSVHRADDWRCRLCGADDDRTFLQPDLGAAEFCWKDAGNEVQWKPNKQSLDAWARR